jgi:hypothetical protein
LAVVEVVEAVVEEVVVGEQILIVYYPWDISYNVQRIY